MPTEILPGIYDITVREEPDGRRYRVFLFNGATPTLFDTGYADTTQALFRGIDEIGIRPERLIITHADGDHAGGFDDVTAEYTLTSWVPKQAELDAETPPDHRFGDGDTIGRFTAVHVPGHEPENHVVIDEAASVAVMGDAVSGADQRGLPSGYLHLPPAAYSQDLNLAEESLERLLEYDFDAALVFHGSSVLDKASEKLEAYVNFPGKPDT